MICPAVLQLREETPPSCPRRRKKDDFLTRIALIMTLATIVWWVILATVYAPKQKSGLPAEGLRPTADNERTTTTISSSLFHTRRQLNQLPVSPLQNLRRWLSEEGQVVYEELENSSLHDSSSVNYTSYSCHDIYEVTPQSGDDQCRFARSCNQGQGLWAPFAFCSSTWSTAALVTVLSPVMILWMVVLFRMLGSTAEDYFSPALEMFSVQLGLPPRFAGVSLLALGNGAADVSATVSAITSDPQQGYKLSLGALSGAAMFISGVVSAAVVLEAGGVPCRGALVRDVTMLLITVLAVWYQLSTGRIGPEAVTLFLSLYFAFVFTVLVADVYHRAVVIPRRAWEDQQQERQRQLEEEQRVQASAISSDDGLDPQQQQQPLQHDQLPFPSTASRPSTSRFSRMITALSNYDNVNRPNDGTMAAGQDGWGVESDDLAQDRPILLHGSHGILRGDGHVPSSSSGPSQTRGDGEGGDGHAGDGTMYSMLDDAADRACMVPGAEEYRASNWSGAFYHGHVELMEHAQSVWDDIVWNGDVHPVSKLLLLCELPFTALRQMTVPIPCDGYYNRPLIALSLAVSPFWVAYYLWDGHEVAVLAHAAWIYFSLYGIILGLAGLLVLRYAPGGEGPMPLSLAGPIAIYGFAIAATWIDTIANALVSLLDFLGIILRIPGPIIGLTILAWGNSVSDLTADLTMARKGLANMAMTACFAGPVFNILIGLGLGFSGLLASTGKSEIAVELSGSVITGFLFIAINCVMILVVGLYLGQGRISKQFGYIALLLYVVYLISSFWLQFSETRSSGNN